MRGKLLKRGDVLCNDADIRDARDRRSTEHFSIACKIGHWVDGVLHLLKGCPKWLGDVLPSALEATYREGVESGEECHHGAEALNFLQCLHYNNNSN